MTERNQGRAGQPADDGLVPGFEPGTSGEDPRQGSPEQAARPTIFDLEKAEGFRINTSGSDSGESGGKDPETGSDPVEPPTTGDRRVAGSGGFAPPDGEPARATSEQRQQPPPAPIAPPGVAPPGAGPHGGPQGPPPGAPGGPPSGDGRPRPAFVPFNAEPPPPQGWPQHAPGHVPVGHAQPPPGGLPPGGGPQPMVGYGRPPGGPPNWAPVPGAPPKKRSSPGFGAMIAIVAIVALLAGGVGAGLTVALTDRNGSGPISLGPDSPGAGPNAKNRPPDSVAGIAQKVLPSVVMIRVRSGSEEGTGTGFIVNGGYIVTNHHVVAPGQGGSIEVVFNDKKTLPASIKGADPSSDVAVLQPGGNHNLPALATGNSEEIAVGDPVIAIGSPLGLQGTVTTGIVSSMSRAVPTRGAGNGETSFLNAIQTDAAINPGNSGGPLVDARGRVIGINTAIATLGGRSLQGETQGGSIGLGFAIPINQAKRIAEEIINTGTVKKPIMGVVPDPRSQGGARIIARGEMPGAEQPVTPNGPADRAGLKSGDVITKVDDKAIDDAADLIAFIRSKAPGDKVKVTYKRGEEEKTVDLTLAAG